MGSQLVDQSELLQSPPDRQSYRPHPAIARAIRAQSEPILKEWRGRTLFAMPDLSELTRKEFVDDVARILVAMADALESNSPADLRTLVNTAPSHGFQRILLDFDIAEVFAEERILRRVIVERVEDELDRQLNREEAAALHSMIDIMLQQGVMAMVVQQREQLRRAAEGELKYLSFLSHDLSNNLSIISLRLHSILRQLSDLPELRQTAETISAALKVIMRTTRGMRTLLMHERLHRSVDTPVIGNVNLREVVETIVKVVEEDADINGCALEILIDRSAMIISDAGLVTIILQNLTGNAVKHTCSKWSARGGNGRGLVRIEAERRPPTLPKDHAKSYWKVSVIDNGPGIPADRLEHLFKPFTQGPEEIQSVPDPQAELGVGLGLAIASQAATIAGTRIEVQTKLGEGSTFSFLLPAG